MKNSITYYIEKLKMIENIDGNKTSTKFKNLAILLEDKKEVEQYILENPKSARIKIIIK
tara:strand:- start:1636 stop:1812 length:177 start_codon:yes stop_codon:yes gene_type:complete